MPAIMTLLATSTAVVAMSQSVPTPEAIRAAILAERAALTAWSVTATIEDSAGLRMDVLVAYAGGRARWREQSWTADGAPIGFEAATDGLEGLIWSGFDPAQPALRTTRSELGRAMHDGAGARYLTYMHWQPIDTDASTSDVAVELQHSPAFVHPTPEEIGGVSTWRVDLLKPDGETYRSHWLAPSRSWLPLKSIAWSNGTALIIKTVTGFVEPAPGRFFPSAGRTDFPLEGGAWQTMTLTPRGEGGVPLNAIAELDVPAALVDVLPAGVAVLVSGEYAAEFLAHAGTPELRETPSTEIAMAAGVDGDAGRGGGATWMAAALCVGLAGLAIRLGSSRLEERRAPKGAI
jgi:hypothetical protein